MKAAVNFFTKKSFYYYITLIIVSITNTIFASAPKQQLQEITVTIKNHRFEPEIIKVPAEQAVKLIVRNEDETVEEFESIDLKREKIIPGKSEVTVILSRLKAGRYKFFGEFHPETAKGEIIVE